MAATSGLSSMRSKSQTQGGSDALLLRKQPLLEFWVIQLLNGAIEFGRHCRGDPRLWPIVIQDGSTRIEL